MEIFTLRTDFSKEANMLNLNIRTYRKYLLAWVIFAVIALALPSRAQAGTASGKVKARQMLSK